MTSEAPTPAPLPAHFDEARQAWVLSRHADVRAALSDARLAVPGAASATAPPGRPLRTAGGTAAGRQAGLVEMLSTTARAQAAGLPDGGPVDLVDAFARPWSLEVASRITGAPDDHTPDLTALALRVFRAAAAAESADPDPDGAEAAAALAARVSDPQAFVALTCTLPAVLAGGWLALLDHPEEARRLRDEPARGAAAVEELLRYAGPSRAVFREAGADLEVGRAAIARGDRVILQLAAANRDPRRFEDPNRLDLGREAAGHVAFGAGPHRCPGASVIRLAVLEATRALLGAVDAMEPAGPVEWSGGFAIRAPSKLPVVLLRRP